MTGLEKKYLVEILHFHYQYFGSQIFGNLSMRIFFDNQYQLSFLCRKQKLTFENSMPFYVFMRNTLRPNGKSVVTQKLLIL